MHFSGQNILVPKLFDFAEYVFTYFPKPFNVQEIESSLKQFDGVFSQQTILMKYHELFVIFEKAANFEIVVCCKLKVALYGLNAFWLFADLFQKSCFKYSFRDTIIEMPNCDSLDPNQV